VNLDLSVAPEIAQLVSREPRAAGLPPAPGGSRLAGGGHTGAGPAPTVGRLAQQLRLITAAPERWWALVRFDQRRPVRVRIPADRFCEVWLMIIPPAAGGRWAGDDAECGCEVVTVVAGEVTEQAINARGVATTPLLPGKVRVHGRGQLHQVTNRSGSYAVSVHARGRAVPAAEHGGPLCVR
jgi:hypothetical protein